MDCLLKQMLETIFVGCRPGPNSWINEIVQICWKCLQPACVVQLLLPQDEYFKGSTETMAMICGKKYRREWGRIDRPRSELKKKSYTTLEMSQAFTCSTCISPSPADCCRVCVTVLAANTKEHILVEPFMQGVSAVNLHLSWLAACK